ITLPPRYTHEAPSKFRGSYSKVEDFVEHYERLLVKYNVTDDGERCEGILRYCSSKVRRSVKSLTSYRQGNWKEFKYDILKSYDADRARNRYQPSDIRDLALEQTSQPIDNLSKWLKYVRRFQERAGAVVRMSKELCATYFWLGIPQRLREILEPTVPYDIDEVCEIAERYFKL
ncbi:hypothetical protein L218DRAFT_1044381, partial [Marasmius fiardii PR-910]